MPHKTFKEISNFISEFSVSSFNKEDMVIKYLKYFSIEKLCFKLSEDNKDYSFSKLDRTVSEKEIKPYEPEYNDLCRLHYLILKRKTLTVLEFGSGFSTSVIAHALSILKEYFNEWAIKNKPDFSHLKHEHNAEKQLEQEKNSPPNDDIDF